MPLQALKLYFNISTTILDAIFPPKPHCNRVVTCVPRRLFDGAEFNRPLPLPKLVCPALPTQQVRGDETWEPGPANRANSKQSPVTTAASFPNLGI